MGGGRNLRVPPFFVPCRAVPPMGGGGKEALCRAVPCQVFLPNNIPCRGTHVLVVQIWTACCSFSWLLHLQLFVCCLLVLHHVFSNSFMTLIQLLM